MPDTTKHSNGTFRITATKAVGVLGFVILALATWNLTTTLDTSIRVAQLELEVRHLKEMITLIAADNSLCYTERNSP